MIWCVEKDLLHRHTLTPIVNIRRRRSRTVYAWCVSFVSQAFENWLAQSFYARNVMMIPYYADEILLINNFTSSYCKPMLRITHPNTNMHTKQLLIEPFPVCIAKFSIKFSIFAYILWLQKYTQKYRQTYTQFSVSNGKVLIIYIYLYKRLIHYKIYTQTHGTNMLCKYIRKDFHIFTHKPLSRAKNCMMSSNKIRLTFCGIIMLMMLGQWRIEEESERLILEQANFIRNTQHKSFCISSFHSVSLFLWYRVYILKYTNALYTLNDLEYCKQHECADAGTSAQTMRVLFKQKWNKQ